MGGLLLDKSTLEIVFLSFADLILILLDHLVGVLQLFLNDIALNFWEFDAISGFFVKST
jgi:hypothetical protein